ncbi:hypothetical protein [Umezawaea sp. Da 62-37]|uniref:hypothetical protein n=1 Tax=Umezawaea sp. Da 62-37 TaxID=3075927 RepID=UPI0028F6C800|nr:hypothetical protein [Umezawaea sp. Da 62-37]WNV83048.1 hypothetical protein RM788_33315 [Umezawaea sp. Da 62-37]
MTATATTGIKHEYGVWSPDIDAEVARQYGLGLGLSHLAAITGKPRSALTRMLAGSGTPLRHRHARPDPEIVLWEADPVLLALVLHEQDVIARYRPPGGTGLGARVRGLVGRDTPRLMDRVESLPAAQRADAMLRLLIACPYAPGLATLDALTRAGVAAAEQGDPQTAPAVYGWLALLHATTGQWKQALHHSTTENQLHLDLDGGVDALGDEVHAAVHARWRHAALLAAAGDHEAAVHVHTALDLVLTTLADIHERITTARSLADGYTRAALLRARARNHAALGTQALCAHYVQTAVDALKDACDLFVHLQVHLADPVLHPILPMFERSMALFALGYARSGQKTGTGRYELQASAGFLMLIPALDEDLDRRGDDIVRRIRPVARGETEPFPPPPARLLLPRIHLTDTTRRLLDADVVRRVPCAPLATFPDLAALH